MATDPRTPVTSPEARLVEIIRQLQLRIENLERQMARLQGKTR